MGFSAHMIESEQLAKRKKMKFLLTVVKKIFFQNAPRLVLSIPARARPSVFKENVLALHDTELGQIWTPFTPSKIEILKQTNFIFSYGHAFDPKLLPEVFSSHGALDTRLFEGKNFCFITMKSEEDADKFEKKINSKKWFGCLLFACKARRNLYTTAVRKKWKQYKTNIN